MSAHPVYKYIISKYLDPVFALAVGVSAAGVRIRREELENGRNATEAWEVLKRRVRYSMGIGAAQQDTAATNGKSV